MCKNLPYKHWCFNQSRRLHPFIASCGTQFGFDDSTSLVIDVSWNVRYTCIAAIDAIQSPVYGTNESSLNSVSVLFAGYRQFFTICSRQVWQGICLDDRLWQDHPSTERPKEQPQRSLEGRRQPGGWVLVWTG